MSGVAENERSGAEKGIRQSVGFLHESLPPTYIGFPI
jgi:hypothetical protein